MTATNILAIGDLNTVLTFASRKITLSIDRVLNISVWTTKTSDSDKTTNISSHSEVFRKKGSSKNFHKKCTSKSLFPSHFFNRSIGPRSPALFKRVSCKKVFWWNF